MRYLLLLAMLLLPLNAWAWGPMAVIAGSAPIPFVETGDTYNRLSNWTSTDSVNGQMYYYDAIYDEVEGMKTVSIYSDVDHTILVSQGITDAGGVSFSGTLNGSVSFIAQAGGVSISGTIIFPNR